MPRSEVPAPLEASAIVTEPLAPATDVSMPTLIACELPPAAISDALPAPVARPLVAPTLASSDSEKPSARAMLLMVSAVGAGAASPTRRLPNGMTVGATEASASRNTPACTEADAVKDCGSSAKVPRPDVPAPLDTSRTCTCPPNAPAAVVSSVTTNVVVSVPPAARLVTAPAPLKPAAVVPKLALRPSWKPIAPAS